MKKKNIFLMILIGIVALLGVKTTTWSVDKKEYKENEKDVYGTWNLSLDVNKVGENESFLSDVKFKLSSYNNNYSKVLKEDDGYYYISEYIEGEEEFDKIYNSLSDYQKAVIETIKTTDDLSKINHGENIECYYTSGEQPLEIGPQFRMEEGYYCYTKIPTVFFLEETDAPEGYVKDKVLVPGEITLTYLVKGYEDQENAIRSIPNENINFRVSDYFGVNSYDIELVDLYSSTMNNGYSIKYGTVSLNRLTSVDIEDAWNVWDENAIKGLSCYTDIIVSDNAATSSPNAQLNRNDPVCGIYLKNEKGTVNFSISSFVNDKDLVTTTSNTKLQYRVIVKNTGTVDAIDNIITSTLPEGFVYVEGSASDNGEYVNGTVQWRVDRLNKEEEMTLTYVAYAPNGVSATKNYIGEANVSSFALQNRVESNKTVVKLSLMNPETGSSIMMIGTVLVVISVLGTALRSYYYNKKEKVEN